MSPWTHQILTTNSEYRNECIDSRYPWTHQIPWYRNESNESVTHQTPRYSKYGTTNSLDTKGIGMTPMKHWTPWYRNESILIRYQGYKIKYIQSRYPRTRQILWYRNESMNSSDTKERNTYILVKHETTNSYIWYKNESMRPYDTKKVQE